MKKHKRWAMYLVVAGLTLSPIHAYQTGTYLTQDAYNEAVSGMFYEDRGIVVANYPALGYMVYRNARGEEVTAHYYSGDITVEKTPYYEQEDKIGYIDEIFPSFNYDTRDTTIQHITAGDNIYLRMNQEGYVTYISAFNDYTIKYGKVHTFTMGANGFETLILEEEDGDLYTYNVSTTTPISKGGDAYSLGRLHEGEWVKLLVSQKILGQGIIEESVLEIAVDPDSRVISNVYRGELIDSDRYQNTLMIKNNQTFTKSGWSQYESLVKMSMNPNVIKSYFLGNPVSLPYVESQLLGNGDYVYIAVEEYMGREQAIKLNFQRNRQTTLPTTTITYTSPGVIHLLTGERIMLSEDTILVRNDRLVGPASAMAGDKIQAVVTGENKLAVGVIDNDIEEGMLQIFRGRIKDIDNFATFEVGTFSMLSEGEWYFHPTERTFAIGPDTKLYGVNGIELGGMDQFLMDGVYSKEDEVFTIIAKGDEALRIVDMPYTKESVRGTVYNTENGIQLKDLYYYDDDRERWREVSGKNITAGVTIQGNTVVIKDGEIVPQEALEEGDKLTVMMETAIEVTSQDADMEIPIVGQIIIAE